MKNVVAEDLQRIVEIHIKAFPNFFMTQLGFCFLEKYYGLVLEYPGSIFIAVTQGDVIKGFVAGFLSPNEFYSLLKRKKLSFLSSVIVSALRNPKLIIRILYNLRRVNYMANESDKSIVELASIAVDPQDSGKGFGKVLVKSFLEKARELRADYVYLTTDSLNNDYVNKFYQALGFMLYKTFKTSPDRIMNEYRFYFKDYGNYNS